MTKKKVLFVVTSHSILGKTGRTTGIWFEELATPYYVFTDAGYKVRVVSVAGGPVPIDPESLLKDGNNPPSVERFLQDSSAKDQIRYSNSTTSLNIEDYEAIFLPGGHGTMWDLPNSCDLARLVMGFYAAGKPVGAVCHGPAGLIGSCKPNGEPLVKGLRMTGFTNGEEEAVELTGVVPFLLENRLTELGATFVNSDNFQPNTIIDGNLITGQNPQSSEGTANALLDLLRS